MKKRAWSFILSLCIFCGLTPMTVLADSCDVNDCGHVAAIGNEHFDSIQAAVDAAEIGNKIIVIRNHNLNCNVTTGGALIYVGPNKDITIDLNGNEIIADYSSATEYTKVDAILKMANGSRLILTDSSPAQTGILYAKTTSDNGNNTSTEVECLIYNGTTSDNQEGENGYKLIIEGGTYKMEYCSKDGGSLLYSQQGNQTTWIKDGIFRVENIGGGNSDSPWIFNIRYQDANRFVVTGGTFNADINHQFWENEVYVPENRALKENSDGTWTVVNSVAYVEEQGIRYPNNSNNPSSFYFRKIGYSTLEEAVKSANNYADDGIVSTKTNTVVLTSNCAISSTLEITEDVIIRCNDASGEYTITYNDPSGRLLNVMDGVILQITPAVGDNNARMNFPQNVTEWCADGYASVENENGTFDVVPGYKVRYYYEDQLLYTEGVQEGDTAKGYIHKNDDQAIFDWKTTPDAVQVSFPLTINGDIDLCGIEYVNAYTANFNDGSGSSVESQIVRDNGKVSQPSEPPEKTGYSFENWYISSDGGITLDTIYDFDTQRTSDITLYAKWTPVTYSITHVLNGGIVDGTNPVEYTIESEDITLINPNKPGNIFKGWTGTDLTDPELVVTIPTGSVGNRIYTANWEPVRPTGSKRPTQYSVTAGTSENGTVEFDYRYAEYGQEVTITVTPDEGYVLETIRVTDRYGEEVEISYIKDGTYVFEMPRGAVDVYVVFTKEVTFKDVDEKDYFYDAVMWAVANGVTSGTSADNFSPDATCTRAQTVTFLWNAAGKPEPKATDCPFVDVAPTAYYYKAVLWAVEEGITAGTSATTFGPDKTVTRGQNVTFLWKFADKPSVDDDSKFSDVTEANYYHDAVVWAKEEGITAGTSATTFGPEAPCTRGQIVTFLYRHMVEE